MKLGALSLVYNEEKLVKGCVESLRPFVESHMMVVGLKPYFGKAEPQDRSADIAGELGCTVLSGYYKMDHDQRNAGLNLMQGCGYDWIICSDVDMWFEHKTVEALIERLKDVKEDAVVMSQYSYWKDTDHRLVNDDFMPVVAIRPHVRFSYIGNVDCPYHKIEDLKLHHLAWCEPKDIYKKIRTYSHHEECGGMGFWIPWYNQYYLNWKEGQKAMFKGKRFDVERQPLPEELKAYL
jgi:hypothetical protein